MSQMPMPYGARVHEPVLPMRKEMAHMSQTPPMPPTPSSTPQSSCGFRNLQNMPCDRSDSSCGSFCTSLPSGVSSSGTALKHPGVMRPSQEVIQPGKQDSNIARCREEALQSDFPVGPIQGTVQHVEDTLREWARNCSTGGGGHGIRKGGETYAKSRGRRVRFQCSKNSSRSETCKWECTFEETTDEWVLVNAVLTHNGHALLAEAAEVMAAQGTAFVPQVLLDLGNDAADAGQSLKDIDNLLRNAAKRRNLPITWEPTHLRSRFNIRNAASDFDLTGFVETLKQREKEGLGFELRCNDEGLATHMFVQLEDAMKDWANDTSNVLLFDPTWGTHRAGMKLCCFTSVSPHGQSVVLAFALLADETTDSILWSFRAFSKHFKRPPTVVFTDDATSIAISFTSMYDAGIWKDTSHLLCTYHLAKNFFKHIKPLVKDPTEWQKLNSWFWHFAKFSDARFNVEVEWLAFTNHVDNVCSGSTKGQAILWLESLYSRRTRWMAALTWSITSWGVHSTQRAEAIHSALKSAKLKNTSCVNLLQKIIEYNQLSRARKEVDAIRRHLQNTAKLTPHVPVLLHELQGKLTAYAFDLVMSQFALSIGYNSTPTWDTDSFLVSYAGITKVTSFTPVLSEEGMITSWQCDADFGLGDFPGRAGHLTTLSHCTCQYPIVFQLPCRHILHLHFQQQKTSLEFIYSPRWCHKEAEEQSHNLHILRTMSVPSVAARAPSSSLSFGDRRSLLLDELLPLVDAAARNTDSFHILRSSLPALHYAITHMAIMSVPVKEGEASTSSASAQVSATHVSRPLTEDQMRIQKLLGTTYSVVPYTMQPLLGRTVLIKYGQKLWYLATVQDKTESLMSDDMFSVLYDDAEEGVTQLSQQNVWIVSHTLEAPRWSWLLLDEAQLSNHENRNVREPQQKKKGRQRTNRLAPAFGPTAKPTKRSKP